MTPPDPARVEAIARDRCERVHRGPWDGRSDDFKEQMRQSVSDDLVADPATAQLAEKDAEIATWQQMTDSVQQTNAAILKQLAEATALVREAVRIFEMDEATFQADEARDAFLARAKGEG